MIVTEILTSEESGCLASIFLFLARDNWGKKLLEKKGEMIDISETKHAVLSIYFGSLKIIFSPPRDLMSMCKTNT